MNNRTDKQKAEEVEKIALDVGIVAFEPHQVPSDPAKAKKMLKARAALARKHFQSARKAGII